MLWDPLTSRFWIFFNRSLRVTIYTVRLQQDQTDAVSTGKKVDVCRIIVTVAQGRDGEYPCELFHAKLKCLGSSAVWNV